MDEAVLEKSQGILSLRSGAKVRYFSNAAELANPRRAIIMVHGVLRNSERYFLDTRAAAYASGEGDQTLVIALAFDNEDTRPKELNELAIFDGNWKLGSRESMFGSSSFLVMDDMLQDVLKRYPSINKISLAGHSAGGQFIGRYAVLNDVHEYMQQTELRYFVMAPSSHLYLREERPQFVGGVLQHGFAIPEDDCGGEYNTYPYGLKMQGSEVEVPMPSLNPQQLQARFAKRRVFYAVGALDIETDYLDESCAAMKQGVNRLERMEYYFRSLGPDSLQNHSMIVLSGVPHDANIMMHHAAMQALLF
jgi:pimeloyl-ACP methyl ester carboxylesterase